MKTDTVPVIKEYKSFIHAVNITKYEEMFQAINTSIHKLPGDIPSSIQFLMNNLHKELSMFNIIHRHKRGLINVFGKGIKFITGNLDDDDLSE